MIGLKTRIETLKFSTRIKNILKEDASKYYVIKKDELYLKPINTIGQLINCRQIDIIARPNAGKKTIEIIKSKLKQYNLNLKD